MRIGIFTDTYTPDINGVVSSELTLKNALEKLGHTVFVVANHSGSKVIWQDEFTLLLPGLNLKQLYGYKLSLPLNFGAEQYVEDMNLDIIHIQTEFGVGTFGRQMAKQLNIPIVSTYHTMYEDYTHYINPLEFTSVEKGGKAVIRSLSRLLCNSVQGMIAPSIKTREKLMDYGVIAPIYVVPTGLNLESFDPKNIDMERKEEIRAQIDPHKDLHIVGFLGRLAEEKSVRMLIDMMKVTKDDKLRLVVVGAGPDEDKFIDYAKEIGVMDKVIFLGKALPEEVPAYYSAFDLFASASLSETQGMTYLEALACGLMIAGRRDEVLENLIEEGVTGYYFDSAQELAQKLEEFYKLDPETLAKNKEVCMQKAAPYTDKVFAQKVAAIYEQAMDDYQRTYEVEKVMLFDDFALITVQKPSEEESVKFFMPVDEYLEFKVVKGMKLDTYLVSSYIEQQPFYSAFMRAKEHALKKDYTLNEIKAYCQFKLKTSEEIADQIVRELEDRNLLNDKAYAFDKADYWQSVGYSKNQIYKKLAKAGIDPAIISQAVDTLNDEREIINATKMAKNLMRTLKEQSSRMKEQLLIKKLMAKGYSMEIARQVSETMDFEEDETQALQYTFRKAQRLYASLPEPKRSEKIVQYCLRKGFDKEQLEDIRQENEDTYEN